MRYVQLLEDGGVTEFAGPQDASDKPGYTELADDDPVLLRAVAAQVKEPAPRTKDEILADLTALTAEVQALK